MPTSPTAPARRQTVGRFLSFVVPITEASTFEEPGAKKRHAGIRAGAVRATGRPTAMTVDRQTDREEPWLRYIGIRRLGTQRWSFWGSRWWGSSIGPH